MKKPACPLFLCSLLLPFTAPLNATPPLRATITRDLDGDRKAERVVLDARRNPALSVWRGKRCLWRGVKQQWKPWKLTTADVDGDGKREIVLGVYKSTRYIPQPHNCVFIYGWDGRRAYPKWLSSSLSKPFTDFTFADIDHDGKDDLIALETRRDGKQCIVVYSWIGFGYGFEWQKGAWPHATLAGVNGNKVVVNIAGKRLEVHR
jgi:hypothetical protein